MPSDPPSRGRHRKASPISRALRRTLVVAAVTPVAGAVLAGPSAFAAGKAVTTAGESDAPVVLDPAEQKIADHLRTRSQNASLGTTFSGVVLDAGSDKVIWGHDAGTALMPASTAKLGTAVAALTALSPDRRFATRVVYGNGTLTLIGGGDRTLTTSDLATLAETAATALKHAGLSSVEVRIDDSLFPSPTLATGWNESYYDDQVAPVRSLVVDGGGFSADTSMDAGRAFAAQLTGQGITVTSDVTRRLSTPSDVPVAQHASAPLSEIVTAMLKTSNNDTAETLLRLTALATGRPATFDGGTGAVRDILTRHYGVSMADVELHDGSGLSRADRIPVRTVADILDLLTDSRHSHTLKSVDEGLPVAGEAGSTLGPEWGRFDTADSACAVGKVRAKTGTLTGAIALSGLTRAQDGRWKVFSFIENGSTANPAAIKDAMDGLAATVNGCWA